MYRQTARALARAGAGGAAATLVSVLVAGVVAAGPQRSSATPTSAPPASVVDGRHLPASPTTRAVRAEHPVVGPDPTAVRARPLAGRPVPAAPPARSAGSTGFDISGYQCGIIPSAPATAAIVQVTGGALNAPPNPCLVQEAAWAGDHLTAYIYLDGLPNPAPRESLVGPAARCARRSLMCRAYDFGFAWAGHWVAFSRHHGVNPKLWWLDVEAGAGWTRPAANAGVIGGAADGLRSQGASIGIYSTPYQWATIAGTLAFPGVPLWIPGAGRLTGGGFTATAYCKSGGQRFAGGHVAMVQWGYTGQFPGAYGGPPSRYDQDYVCPGDGVSSN